LAVYGTRFERKERGRLLGGGRAFVGRRLVDGGPATPDVSRFKEVNAAASRTVTGLSPRWPGG